uniref:N-terminal EF-hand calcium binding protein 3 n=1 Tax=Amphiprion ocellaris TaxID=80972 RepID=A0AAQ5XX37_AMPOC
MLACTELITMCLQSAKHEHLRKQQELDHNQNQGVSIFQDIFRRADKNDDGKLSLEEFQSYFTDGILTDEQMQELYRSIDRQQTDNLDIDKLSEYFTPHLGEYVNVLSALEKLNVAILKAMDKTKESPHLEPLKEDTLAGTYKSNILLVQRQMSVKERDVEQFQQALKIYTDATTSQIDNLHVSVQNLPDRSCFIMYEFWQDRLSWMSYLQSSISKTFQRCIIDSLEQPEMVSTMLLPASWWIMNNN